MPTSLSTQQRRLLHDALIDTFKDIDDLEQLATYGLDANLSAIVVVHGRNLTKIVADLIRWSESEPGGIHRLIAAALDRVPESHELRTIADEWAEIEFRVRPTRETEQTRRIFAWIIGGTVAAIVLGVLVVFNWGQIQKTIQALNPPRVSPHEFGIAVADFGILEEDDSVRYSNDSSKAASESVVGRLQGIYDEIADQTNYAVPADIRYNHGDDPKPFRPSFFRGQTKEEREGKAHRLSKNLNALLVIYGELEESEPVDMASFRFFMSDKLLVTGTFDYLQHFTGSHGLGKPFAYEFETSLDETNKQIDLRLRTLLWLTRAIQVYATDSTDALNLLDQAEKNILENYGERGEEPLELIYLLRGFIQIELKDPDAAAESFKTALEIRPDMHRARIGMGSVHFLNTFDFSQSEEDKLKEIDRAIEYYEGALEDISPDNREEHTYAQLALGIGLTWRASIRYTLQRPSEDIDPDIGVSDALLTPIVEHPDQISPGLIVYAYNALGVNEEIRIGLLKEQNLEPSLEDAQNYYRKCLDSVDETKHNTQGVADTRENCETRLKELEKAKNLSEETP